MWNFYLINIKVRISKKTDSFKFDWEGGLSDANIKVSSVDLQHKALDWR